MSNIEGFENYSIDEKGKVFSIKRGKFLKPKKDKDGYMCYTLYNEGKREHKFEHRLVAQAFIPNPDNKPQINHINGIKHDNRIENLEWCTNSENQIHSYRVLGTINKGGLPRKKVIGLDDGIVYESVSSASRHNNTTPTKISECCRGVLKKTGGRRYAFYE